MKVLLKSCITVFATILAIALALLGVVYIEIESATKTVNQFMSAMDNRDIDTAYNLFATRAQKIFPMAEFKKALVEENFEVYAGYEKIVCRILQFDTGNPGPFPDPIRIPGSYPQPTEIKLSATDDTPLGKTILINGSIRYKDGYKNKTGLLGAFMERENSGWRILLIIPSIREYDSCTK